jgi:mannose-6-phosphate isomerase-like protein (cupin superfamily)
MTEASRRGKNLVQVVILAGLCGGLAAPEVRGQDPALAPQIIDVAALTDADLGPILTGTLRAKTLLSTTDGSISVQAGNAPRHTHQNSVEIQYVVSGSGTFWLGDSARQVHAGDLIVIPKGVAHGGSRENGSELKMIAIKLPPQVKGDMQLVP